MRGDPIKISEHKKFGKQRQEHWSAIGAKFY